MNARQNIRAQRVPEPTDRILLAPPARPACPVQRDRLPALTLPAGVVLGLPVHHLARHVYPPGEEDVPLVSWLCFKCPSS